MGLDSYVDVDAGTTINAVIYQKSNGSNKFKYLELGSGADFDFVKSSDDVMNLNAKKFAAGNYESTFVQELDNVL